MPFRVPWAKLALPVVFSDKVSTATANKHGYAVAYPWHPGLRRATVPESESPMHPGIILLVVILLILVVAVVVVLIYNRLIALRTAFQNAYSQIDVQAKRRYDLIPNLVT